MTNFLITNTSAPIDLTTTDKTQNLQISTKTVTVQVKDSNGNPMNNVTVSDGNLLAPTTALMAGSNSAGRQIGLTTQTDTSGQAVLTLLTGSVLDSAFCAYPDGVAVCGTGDIVNSDVTILFQQSPQAPASPTGLSAVTPTNNAPALTWNTVANAVNYRVYRDGNQVGTSATPNFVDLVLATDGSYNYTVTAVSSNNLESPPSAPFTVVYDTTAPSVAASATKADGSAYTAGTWTNQTVTVHFTCSDSLSGVATCPADHVVASNTAVGGEDVAGTATDNAGNSATTSPFNVKVDKTAPTISASAAKADGGTYTPGTWVNQTVTVHFTCADALSGIASCPADQVLSSDTTAAGVDATGTTTDNAGNSITSSPLNVKIDKSSPSITAHATTPGGDYTGGWTNETVTIHFTCSDSLSGLATCPDDTVISSSTPVTGTSVTGTTTDNAGNSATSASVLVKVDKDAPTITASATKADGGAYTPGTWVNQNVTGQFACSDPLSGVASCPADQVLSANTPAAGVDIEGTATDNAGNSATSASLNVKIDKDLPTVGNATWSTNPIAVGNSATLTVPAADTLSGVAEGEYFIGTDPGAGNGSSMSFGSGNLTATNVGASLGVGVYDLGVRARDAAGNWSLVEKTMLVVYDPLSTLGITGKNKQDLVPSLANGDILPGLTTNGQTDVADYGFTVDYKNGVLDTHNDFHFLYTAGTHSFNVDATSFAWLIIDQTNDSRGRFQGVANVTVDGVTTSNPFTVEGVDGDRLTPTTADHLLLKVYAPGANPSTATAIYQASGSVNSNNGNGVKIR